MAGGLVPTRDAPRRGVFLVLALGAIRAYQLTLSPMFRGACRHQPSCSEYALEAVSRHGARGAWLAFQRLFRCRPFGSHGYDPVP